MPVPPRSQQATTGALPDGHTLAALIIMPPLPSGINRNSWPCVFRMYDKKVVKVSVCRCESLRHYAAGIRRRHNMLSLGAMLTRA